MLPEHPEPGQSAPVGPSFYRPPQPESTAAGGARAGLVRLETSDTWEVETPVITEENRTRQHRRRGLRMFKSLSIAGDFLAAGTDPRGRRLRGIFLTATYRPEVMWQPYQWAACLKRMRQWCDRRGVAFRVVWCAEQHKSGRVHYHAVLMVPHRRTLPKPDKQGWWPHGMTRIEWCRKPSVGYLMKYATKGGHVPRPWPKGCRIHGHGGLDGPQRIRRAWWVLPRYIRAQVEPDWKVCRARGGGWVSPVTGEWWPAWEPPALTEWRARVFEGAAVSAAAPSGLSTYGSEVPHHEDTSTV